MPRLSVRSTPRFWRVAVQRKPRAKPDEWATFTLGRGIKVVRFRRGRAWQTYTYLIPKAGFSRLQAITWVLEHELYLKRRPRGPRRSPPARKRRRRRSPGLTLLG